MPDPLAEIDAAVSLLRRRVNEAVAAMPQSASPPLGTMIRLRREILGLSLDEVAKAAGVSKSHVWELEQDRSRNPTVAMVYALAKALSVPFPILAAAALATHLAAHASE